MRILSGPIGNPKKQFHFVTDEKGKIKWNFTTEVRENKFTPKGFKNCKSKLPVTILVETTKESRLLAKYKNYAQMKKKMLARNGKLCKENIIKFNKLELVKTKTVKWRSTLEEHRFFVVSDHENDDEKRTKKPKKKLDEMTKLKNILNDQPAESINDEDDEDEEDDTDDEEDWNVAEEEED
ncbi:hypothetical protein niasHT_029448 [Heterodera trifolii]|uniref:Uncharacterized protein n=1 Tax=Heterodera trifolii TaxID=157864 RepID=A0ABD2KQ38_9BILA